MLLAALLIATFPALAAEPSAKRHGELTGLSSAVTRVGVNPDAESSNGRSALEIDAENTEFRVARNRWSFNRDSQIPRRLQKTLQLFKVQHSVKYLADGSVHSGRFIFSVFDPLSGAKLWQATDAGDDFSLPSDYPLITTELDGCCGAVTTWRARSRITGAPLFSYSLHAPDRLPVILQADPYNPDLMRFVGYLDNHWASRDQISSTVARPDEELVGVLTYASSVQPISRLAVLRKKTERPAASYEPEVLSVTIGTKVWNFASSDATITSYVVGNWFSPRQPAKLTVRQIFDDFLLKLRWSDVVAVIPVEDDRLDVARIALSGGDGVRIVPLPPG